MNGESYSCRGFIGDCQGFSKIGLRGIRLGCVPCVSTWDDQSRREVIGRVDVVSWKKWRAVRIGYCEYSHRCNTCQHLIRVGTGPDWAVLAWSRFEIDIIDAA